MLTDAELDNPYLNPGFLASAGHLRMYWTAILERPVEMEEVYGALRQIRERYCQQHVDECEDDRHIWDELIAENARQHHDNITFWRNQK